MRRRAESNSASFDEPKPKGMRHSGASQRVNHAPPAPPSYLLVQLEVVRSDLLGF